MRTERHTAKSAGRRGLPDQGTGSIRTALVDWEDGAGFLSRQSKNEVKQKQSTGLLINAPLLPAVDQPTENSRTSLATMLI